MLLNVKTLAGNALSLEIDGSATVYQLKEKIQALHRTPITSQRLIFAGRCMKDEETLASNHVEHETSIMMVVTGPSTMAPAPKEDKGEMMMEEKRKSSMASAPVTTTVRLNIKTLAGVNIQVDVPPLTKFGEVKVLIEKIAGFPHFQMKLIYAGQLIDDSKTPSEYNCQSDTCIHLVRRVDVSILDEVVTADRLKANCPVCHTAGTPMKLRYKCRSCGAESIMLTGAEVAVGKSKYRDLLNLKCECFACGKEGGLVNVGFMCAGRVEGVACPSTRPDVRTMAFEYKGPDGDALTKVLNDLYGYAHAGGFQTKI